MFKWIGSLVGSNEKEVERLSPIIDHINSLETQYESLSNDELRRKTDEFKDISLWKGGLLKKERIKTCIFNLKYFPIKIII